MQTDLDRFLKLYRSFGIICNVIREDDERKVIVFKVSDDKYFDASATYSDKFNGYTNCYTQLVFDKNEKLIAQGFWIDDQDHIYP